MSDDKKLIFLLVHGIGPQDPEVHDRFLASVRDSAGKHLGKKLGLLNRLVTLRADWSDLFKDEGNAWLESLFPEHDDPAIKKKRLWRLRCFAFLTLLIAVVGAIYFYEPLTRPIPTILSSLRLNAVGYVAVWFLVAILTVVLLAILTAAFLWIAWRFYIGFRLPWGDVWNLGRGFEADNLSDIILYQSDEPRRKIIERVVDKLRPHLPEDNAVDRQPVILAGHSLGSVVVYDMLLGAAAEARSGGGAVQREIGLLEKVTERSKSQQDRLRFLTDVRDMLTRLRIVGMVTFGSPIALFLFREPELLKRRNLWREACPPWFEVTGMWDGLRWKWQNFWHTADFVAHRLEPMFNEGYPAGCFGRRFVEDVRVRCPATGPLTAHSLYWTNDSVADGIGKQLAACLLALNRGQAVSGGNIDVEAENYEEV